MLLAFGNSSFNLGTASAVTVYSMYLRLNISSTPDLKNQTAITRYNTVLDPITGNFKENYLCRILDKITRRAKRFRIIGDPDNQRPDN
jgi:hypothetical protein